MFLLLGLADNICSTSHQFDKICNTSIQKRLGQYTDTTTAGINGMFGNSTEIILIQSQLYNDFTPHIKS